MTSNFSPRRVSLRLVHPGPSADDHAAADFYDRTITAVWRLATSLYPTDVRCASDAVVEAYRAVWDAGPQARDQAALLHALVTGYRISTTPVPA